MGVTLEGLGPFADRGRRSGRFRMFHLIRLHGFAQREQCVA